MLEGKFEIYSAELLKTKMLIETRLIERTLGKEASTAEKMNWIEKNSAKFRLLFDIKKADQVFLKRCVEETDIVVEEFVHELDDVSGASRAA